MSTTTVQPASPDGLAVSKPDRAVRQAGDRDSRPATFDPTRHCGSALRHDTSEPGQPSRQCTRPKGWGTSHPGYGNCKLHTGSVPSGIKHAQTEAAQNALTLFGVPVQKNPQAALLELVWTAAGNCSFLLTRVNALLDAEGLDSLVGHTYGIAQREGMILPIGEEARAVVKLYGEWCDRLAKYAKAAIDAGIAEREVRLAEQQASIIVRVIEVTLAGIGATSEQIEQGRKIASSELAIVAVGHPERN